MKIGKILVLIGAILTLASTFLLSFGQTNGTDGRTLISGIGFLFNLPEIFGNVTYWNGLNGGETTLQYTFAIIFIVFMLSGIIQLVGVRNRYSAFIGSLIALAFGIIIVIFIAVDIPGFGFNRYSSLFWRDFVVGGIFPFDIPVIAASGTFYQFYSLGTIILLIGSILGLVGAIFHRKT